MREPTQPARGPIEGNSPEGGPLTSAAVDCPVPHRNSPQIHAWLHERRWSIRGTDAFDDMALIDGRTDDLDQVAVAARAWHDGESLSDISRAAPFVHLTGRFELPGPRSGAPGGKRVTAPSPGGERTVLLLGACLPELDRGRVSCPTLCEYLGPAASDG
jgi:hypothetical protein